MNELLRHLFKHYWHTNGGILSDMRTVYKTAWKHKPLSFEGQLVFTFTEGDLIQKQVAGKILSVSYTHSIYISTHRAYKHIYTQEVHFLMPALCLCLKHTHTCTPCLFPIMYFVMRVSGLLDLHRGMEMEMDMARRAAQKQRWYRERKVWKKINISD